LRQGVLATVAAAGTCADAHGRAAVRLPAMSASVRRPVEPASAPTDARRRQEVRLLALQQNLLENVASRQAHGRRRLSTSATILIDTTLLFVRITCRSSAIIGSERSVGADPRVLNWEFVRESRDRSPPVWSKCRAPVGIWGRSPSEADALLQIILQRRTLKKQNITGATGFIGTKRTPNPPLYWYN